MTLLPLSFFFAFLTTFIFISYSLLFVFSFFRLDNTRGTFADSGTYALMGAAGKALAASSASCATSAAQNMRILPKIICR